MTVDRRPVVARVFPPGCGMPGCQHHYSRARPGCVCVVWPGDRDDGHLFAANPLCQAHPPVLDVIDHAAYILQWHGYLDPEADELDPEDVAELLDIYQAGRCNDPLCIWFDTPKAIADHWITRRLREFDRAAPVWVCNCGARYKTPAYFGNREEFYHITADGLVGDRAGAVKRNSKGKATHSDHCPACGRRFAGTIADRASPQQALF